MKKIIALSISLLLSTNAFAANSGSCGEDCTFSFNSTTGELTITGTGAMTDYAAYTDAPWIGLRNRIKTITISEGITKVGNWSFTASGALTTVNLPDSLTTIGTAAFKQAGKLKNVEIPSGVKNINSQAFYASGLTSVELPEDLKSLGSWSLAQTALKTVTIPSGITKLPDDLFLSTRSLKEVILPDTLTTIGYRSFYDTGLTSITIPETVTKIDRLAFYNTQLTTIIIPQGVTEIGIQAFKGTTTLESMWCFQSQKTMCQTSINNSNLDPSILHLYGMNDHGRYVMDGKEYASFEDMQNGIEYDHSMADNPIFGTTTGHHPYAVPSKSLPNTVVN